jgi:ribulose-phosphate 3-epimerase
VTAPFKALAPSILSADFSRLGQDVALVEPYSGLLHVDVMDGHFVPNITIGPVVIKALKKVVSIPLDVHLMIENADQYLDAFIDAGADILTVQAEACTHLHRTVHAIKERGIRPGVALNPATPLESLAYILPDIDLVMIMTVNPGFGGQEFIPTMLPKIERLKGIIAKQKLTVEIEVDGGIKVENIKEVARRGADIFVAGSGIFGARDRKEIIKRMRKEIGA